MSGYGFGQAVTATDDGAGIDRILYRLNGKGDFVEYVNEIKFKITEYNGNISQFTSKTIYFV